MLFFSGHTIHRACKKKKKKQITRQIQQNYFTQKKNLKIKLKQRYGYLLCEPRKRITLRVTISYVFFNRLPSADYI